MVHLFRMPEYHDLLTRYESMAQTLENPGLVGAFQGRLGFCRWSFGDFDRAIPILTQAASTCEAAGNAKDAGQAYNHLLWSHVHKANYKQVFTTRDAFLPTIERGVNLRWYLYVLTGSSLASAYLGRWDDAVQEAEKALRLGEEFADHGVLSFANLTLANAYLYQGDVARGLEHAEVAFEQAPTPADRVFTQGWLGWALCRTGDPHRGIAMLEQVVKIQREARFVLSEHCATFLGEGYWLAGDDEKATHTLRENLGIVEPWDMRFQIGAAHRLLGEIALQTNPSQAWSHFERSIATLSEIKAENELALAYAGYGRLHAQQGNVVQARDSLTRALDIFTRLGTLGAPDQVSQALADLPEA